MRLPPGGPYTVSYSIEDAPLLARALQELPDFTHARADPSTEELVWLAPHSSRVGHGVRPLATLRLSDGTLQIESHSRKALHALQVLVEELGSGKVHLLAPSECPSRS
jgi:hypothetical protein